MSVPASRGIFLSAGAMLCQAHTSQPGQAYLPCLACCETLATTVLALPCVSKHGDKTERVMQVKVILHVGCPVMVCNIEPL